MFRKAAVIIFGFLFFATSGRSQISVDETPEFIPYLTVTYGLYLPGADLADRFGLTNYLGGMFTIKTASNFTFSVNGGGYFGNDVREQNLLHAMRTDHGDVLDDNAIIAEILLMERGLQFTAKAGKIIPVGNVNPNSGVHFELGMGYNTHWIRIENQENTIPQLTKEIKKYYDRRVHGFLLTEYIGYVFFSNKGLVNFTAGLDFMQGFNSDYRTYNIDDKSKVNSNRLDLYFGFRVGWSILFRRQMSSAYYYD